MLRGLLVDLPIFIRGAQFPSLTMHMPWSLASRTVMCADLTTGKVTLEVYESAAGNAKTWNMFTKGQRKSITQWKEQTLVSQCITEN